MQSFSMKASKRRLQLAIFIFLISLSIWLFSSDFMLSRSLDYDVYRYLFHAISGDSSLQLGGNYRIVNYLIFVGMLGVGFYLAHLIVAFSCFFLLVASPLVPRIDLKVLCSLLIMSFLLVQTGKDGFLSLMLVSLVAWNPRDIGSQQTSQIMFYKIFSIINLVFSSWIRIQSLGYALLAIAIMRLGWKKASFVSIFLALIYAIYAQQSVDGLDSQLVSFAQESNVPASFLGVSVSGIGFDSFLVRLFFYLSSNIALPFVYILRAVTVQQVPSYIIYVYFIVLVLLLALCGKPRIFSKFMATLLPFCLFLSASPIVHFRYLLSVMPFAIIYISASSDSWSGDVIRA